MEWAIAELVNHPTIQSKIRDEISKVLKGEPVTESNLHELPYLQATVKETLRLHTPIPLLVPHMNLQEAKLGGHTVPKESKVVIGREFSIFQEFKLEKINLYIFLLIFLK